MCGVFGFVSAGRSGFKMRSLQRIAEVTEQRGEHAFGFAWLTQDGKVRAFRQAGKITDHLGLLAMAEGAKMLIGHCRYATHGKPERNSNNHPHRSGAGFIVHNGVLWDHQAVSARLKLNRKTECDTEALALAIARQTGGALLERTRTSIIQFDATPLVMLGLWPGSDRAGRMVIAKAQGQPLHTGNAREGMYVASLPIGLPGEVQEADDDHIWSINGNKFEVENHEPLPQRP